MKRKIPNILLATVFFGVSTLLSIHTGYGENENGFVGSKGCLMCHPYKNNKKEKNVGKWENHTHAKMLLPVKDGKTPKGINVTLPKGISWNDISYIAGGGTYYARFIDSKGYVVTGPEAQWSPDGKKLTPFMEGSPSGSVRYEDIKFHSVGWRASGSYKKGVVNNLEGIPGAWFENGVGCEACHGPGHEHAAVGPPKLRELKKEKGDLKILSGKKAKKSDVCGQCHKRTDDDKLILFTDDMVLNRQQYTEMLLNKKAKFKFTCVMCHDPHAGARSKEGIASQCKDCHKGKYNIEIKIDAMADLSCEDCHMPYANRGAYDTMLNEYHKGDMRSHIFGISVDPNYKLNDGTGHAALDENGFARLTVEMTCYACHKSGEHMDIDRNKLLERAKKIH